MYVATFINLIIVWMWYTIEIFLSLFSLHVWLCFVIVENNNHLFIKYRYLYKMGATGFCAGRNPLYIFLAMLESFNNYSTIPSPTAMLSVRWDHWFIMRLIFFILEGCRSLNPFVQDSRWEGFTLWISFCFYCTLPCHEMPTYLNLLHH